MWARTRPLQSAYAAAELVCRGRVVILVSVVSTAAVGPAILPYNSIGDNPTYTYYQKIRFEPLFATSSFYHSEAQNDQGRRVKLEFKRIRDKTAPF